MQGSINGPKVNLPRDKLGGFHFDATAARVRLKVMLPWHKAHKAGGFSKRW